MENQRQSEQVQQESAQSEPVPVSREWKFGTQEFFEVAACADDGTLEGIEERRLVAIT